MTKYVRETKAGKSISAWIITKGTRYVATVQSHYSDGGSVLVNVFQTDAAAQKSAKVLGKPWPPKNFDSDFTGFLYGRAGGYGYDKFTAAISGLVIDGHRMSNHCGASKKPPAAGVWPRDAKAPKGWRFANYDKERDGYRNLYRIEGLHYLEAIGYTVHSAI